MGGTRRQGLVHRHRQRRKFLEVLIMGGPFLRLLPPIFNWVVVRRIGRQRIGRDPLAMGRQKWLGCLARVLPRSILAQKQVRPRVGPNHLPERLGTVRGEAALEALRAQAPRVIRHGAKHFVAFTLATSFARGRLPPPRPGVAQRAPLGTTRLIFEQEQTLATLGRVEMSRPKAGLWKGKPEVGPHRTHVLAGVEHAKLTPDEPPAQDGGPTGGLTAHDKRPGL